jgi:hypothetical protein
MFVAINSKTSGSEQFPPDISLDLSVRRHVPTLSCDLSPLLYYQDNKIRAEIVKVLVPQRKNECECQV